MECRLRNAESCHGVICRKSSAERSGNYPSSLFCILQPKNSAFPRIAKLPFTCIVQHMCNRCIAASGVPRSLPSVFFVVRLPKNRIVFLQFRLTSKSLPHSKCHVISLIDVIGFNLYNQCDSRTDNRTKPCLICAILCNSCGMTAAVTIAVVTNRHDDRIMQTLVSDIAIFVLKRDVKLQLTNIMQTSCNRRDKNSGRILRLSSRMLSCLYMSCRPTCIRYVQLSSDNMI